MTDPRVAEADRLLLATRAGPGDPARAARLYADAAAAGSGEGAARAALAAALGWGRARDWDEALDLLVRAAELNEPSAQGQLRVLAGEDHSDWRALRAGVDIEVLLTPPPIQSLTDKASVGAVRGFAPPAFCAWLIARAERRLGPAFVNDARTGQTVVSSSRTATHFTLGVLERDLIVAVLQERAARLTQRPVDQHEGPTVISYLPGQRFDLHADFIDPAVPGFQDELRVMGQRVFTLVTYLNDDFTGAPTSFPKLGVDFRGGVGDAVVFANVKPDGTPDRSTVHAGLPPVAGRKWVLSQWLRDRSQPLL